MSTVYVPYAYKSFAFPARSGVQYVSTKTTAKGIENQRRYGRNFPHRVFVLSAITPMIGSVTVSSKRTAKNIVAITAGASPNTSV